MGKVLEMHGAALDSVALFSACPQVSDMTGVGAASRSAQHGTIEHSYVVALPCHATLGQGLSKHTVLICMAVVYSGGAGVQLPRTPSGCSREPCHQLAALTKPLAEEPGSIDLNQLTSNVSAGKQQ